MDGEHEGMDGEHEGMEGAVASGSHPFPYRLLNVNGAITEHCLDEMVNLFERQHPSDRDARLFHEYVNDIKDAVSENLQHTHARFMPRYSAETIEELNADVKQQFDDLLKSRTDGTDGANDGDGADSPPSLQPDDEMTPLAMATKDTNEACPFSAEEFNEAVQLAKKVVEAQFYGGKGPRYKNFQSSVVAILAYEMVHQTLKALPMTKREREAVEQMIDKITTALESSDCQMHAFEDGKKLAVAAKECVKAELTMKEKIRNVQKSLDYVWHDDETRDRAQEKSKTRNLHRYQHEVYIELGLANRKEA